MSPTIAIDYTTALEQGGGIGRYTRELVRALAALDPDTRYRLFAAGQMGDKLPAHPSSNFTFHPTQLNSEWLARLWHRARLPIPIESWVGSIDLLHAPDFTLPPTRKGVRTLLTVHDLSFVRTPETSTPGLRAYLNAVVPRSIARADRVLADSEATRQDVIDLYRTPPEKVYVLYSGVDNRFQPVRDSAALQGVRDRYGLVGGPFVLSVGTVQPRKNYARLIEALHRLNRPDLRLAIAGGEGWLSDDLHICIQQLNMREQVIFTGFVRDDDLPALYSAAAVFAFPSLYEGFGLPVLEAMACGVPVVTSNVSSLPEVAGDAALLVDPYDVASIAGALSQLLENPAGRDTLIERGLKQARAFTWERAARQLLHHYHELVA